MMELYGLSTLVTNWRRARRQNVSGSGDLSPAPATFSR